jgi:hypothetical protein
MSNYTAKRRAGGGLLTAQILNRMIQVQVDNETALLVTYENDVDAAHFQVDAFTTTPGSVQSNSIGTFNARALYVEFPSDITTQTGLDFVGNSGAYESPQSIAIT